MTGAPRETCALQNKMKTEATWLWWVIIQTVRDIEGHADMGGVSCKSWGLATALQRTEEKKRTEWARTGSRTGSRGPRTRWRYTHIYCCLEDSSKILRCVLKAKRGKHTTALRLFPEIWRCVSFSGLPLLFFTCPVGQTVPHLGWESYSRQTILLLPCTCSFICE